MHSKCSVSAIGVIVLSFCCLLTACSSSGTLKIAQPKNDAIPSGHTVSLLVVTDVQDPQPAHKEIVNRMREKLFVKLVTERIFKAAVIDPDPADYRMIVKIRGGRQVSEAARIWWGVMAGPNMLAAAVQVHQNAAKQLIADFEVTGSSAAHPFSSEKGLDDAVREAVDRIIQVLR